MRKICILLLLVLPKVIFRQHMTPRFEQTGGTESPTYYQIVEWWKKLDAGSANVKMMEMGPTDAGFPLHLVLVSGDKDFNIQSIKAKKKAIIFINNAIHPG